MLDLTEFKKDLERLCKIHKWSPTNEQLRAIKADLQRHNLSGMQLTEADVLGIISRHVDDVSHYILDGIDNSDYRTALLMALKASAGK